MIILDAAAGHALPPSRLHWEPPSGATVRGSEAWSRSSRHRIEDLRDEEGHRIPLRDELWVTVYPPRAGQVWRAETEEVALGVVGRGKTPEDALNDWRKRLRTTVQVFFEMRPFEMTEEDREMWAHLQNVIDVPGYKASKPIVVRQLGKVARSQPGLTVVEWEDGTREKVNPAVFDEAFSRFRVGQPFEAVVTRHPLTFRLIRAEAVRRLPGRTLSEERSKTIWDRAVSPKGTEATGPEFAELDEEFWLNP